MPRTDANGNIVRDPNGNEFADYWLGDDPTHGNVISDEQWSERQYNSPQAQMERARQELQDLMDMYAEAQAQFGEFLNQNAEQNKRLSDTLQSTQDENRRVREQQMADAQAEKDKIEADRLARAASGNRRRLALIKTSETGVSDNVLNLKRRKVFGT